MVRFPLFAVLALTLSVSAAFAQSGPLTFSEKGWDFGERLQGATDAHVITIYNQGDRPVKLTNVAVTCGCVKATPSAEVVQPDDTVELRLALDTRRGEGVIEKMIVVETDAPQQKKVELPVRGTIHTIWNVSTQSLQFGDVRSGEGGTASFRIVIRKGHEVEVKKVMSNTGFLRHELAPFTEEDGTHGYDVTLTLSDRVETGYFEDIILVQTDDEAIPQRGLRVFGEILPATEVAPRSLNFGLLVPGQKKTLKVLLTKQNGVGLRVTQVTAPDPMITTEVVEKEEGKVWEVAVTVDPDPEKRELRGIVSIMLDEPGSVTVNVDYSGRILLP